MKIEKKDEWGRDPSVQAMRKVFARMEMDQAGFLDRMKIHRFDQRFRMWRKDALEMFERLWVLASQKGMIINERSAGDIYVHSLARAMAQSGVEIDGGLLPDNPIVEKLVKEFSR